MATTVILAVLAALLVLAIVPAAPQSRGDNTAAIPATSFEGPEASGPVIPSNPAVCEQGSHSITLQSGGLGTNIQATFLADLDTLGAEGGGTLLLNPGWYQFGAATNFGGYSNVSVQGAGMGSNPAADTILTMPVDPVQNFLTDNGTHVGYYDFLTGNYYGPSSNMFDVRLYGTPVNNFRMCNLAVDSQAANINELWDGSILFDAGGGSGHVYSDIEEIGFYAPSGTPNGLHINGQIRPSYNDVVDDFFAPANQQYGTYSCVSGVCQGGPDFLDTGDIANCAEQNVSGLGNFEVELSPLFNCAVENVNITGHALLDPTAVKDNPSYDVPLYSWDGTTFYNFSVSIVGTVAPNAIGLSGGNWYGMSWSDCHFIGAIYANQKTPSGTRMSNVQNSTFVGGISTLPAVFKNNVVTWIPSLFGRDSISLPMVANGYAYGLPGANLNTSTIEGNTFVFPNATGSPDLFVLRVPQVTWSGNTYEVKGSSTSNLTGIPLSMSAGATFSSLTYDPLGGGSPSSIALVYYPGSPGYGRGGATASGLTLITNNLGAPPSALPAPTNLVANAASLTEITLSWVNPSGYSLTDSHVYEFRPDCSTLITSTDEGAAKTTASINGLAWDTIYCFAVTASDSSGQSNYSSPASATTFAPVDVAPSDLTFTNVTQTTATANWTQGSFGDNSTAINDTVYLFVGFGCSVSGGNYSTGGQAIAYQFTGLTPGLMYSVYAVAWNATGPTAPSVCADFTTYQAAPAVATNQGSVSSPVSGISQFSLAGPTLGFFLLGVFGIGVFIGGVVRVRPPRADAYTGGVMMTLGIFLMAVGFVAPYAIPGAI